jgi:hypothetical protein
MLRVGAVPATVTDRLARAPRAFELLARDFAELEILSARPLEPLLRGIDLSGIGARSARALERGRTASQPPPPRRSHLHSIGDGLALESERSASAEFSSEINLDPGNARARRFSDPPPEKVERSQFPGSTPRVLDSGLSSSPSPAASDRDPSAPKTIRLGDSRPGVKRAIEEPADAPARGDSHDILIDRSRSRAVARQALRTRARRAGDSAIADRGISRDQARAGVEELLARASHQLDPARSSATEGPSAADGRSVSSRPSGDALASLDTIARIARIADDLGSRPRLSRNHRVGTADPRPSSANLDPPAIEDQAQDPPRPAFADSGLRGLISRAKRPGGIAVERPAPAPQPEDFARRLDELLRTEARRNGIDLARLTR